MEKIFQVVFYVPETDLELVKEAMFAAGAGRIGNYEKCCWQVLGQGQFKPVASANPHIGTIDELEVLPEYKVEMLCVESVLDDALMAMKRAHPYEEVGHFVFESHT